MCACGGGTSERPEEILNPKRGVPAGGMLALARGKAGDKARRDWLAQSPALLSPDNSRNPRL